MYYVNIINSKPTNSFESSIYYYTYYLFVNRLCLLLFCLEVYNDNHIKGHINIKGYRYVYIVRMK